MVLQILFCENCGWFFADSLIEYSVYKDSEKQEDEKLI
ncbi:hypothetical protein FLJC2902T_11860 [Flavobacterium limnosediminis JC2902]|uniref:Uncharacterized protein n=1 Tax=Flavobacterium limnosediminis JC2902 TaxID=1341181 RepID=V6SXN6_9FLAO|nr:hypothetical protein FLJC2902T_11860 [Flavobacterium limnosediminis JC2902]